MHLNRRERRLLAVLFVVGILALFTMAPDAQTCETTPRACVD